MGFCVCGGSILQCSFGMTPSALMVLPVNKVTTTMPIANILDNKPMVNIMPFGMCSCQSNPAVIAATSAALGVFTPAPCIPVTSAPWTPGSSKTMIANVPAVLESSNLMCAWGGMISIKKAASSNIQIN